MKSAIKKQIIVSVTNDLVSDNRVHKVCLSLEDMGFRVLLVGRVLPRSMPLEPRSYRTRRFSLPFTKGPMFYVSYNIWLFFFLLFSKADVLLSNDLDTLPANYLAARLKKKPLVYDSHEYFTEVPELIHRPRVQRIWEWLEKKTVPHVQAAFTVCDSIAKIYTDKYKVPFRVVRNFPRAGQQRINASGERPAKMIVYQGALNVGRGLEQVIRAMSYLDDVQLVIAGDGDIRRELEELTLETGVSAKVTFLGKLPIHELAQITARAWVGLSIEEDIGLNYHYALPNKLFDYIQAGIPVLVSNLPEMAAVVNHYEVGEVISDMTPQNLSRVLTEMMQNTRKRKAWEKNLEVASSELIWENEEETLRLVFKPFL